MSKIGYPTVLVIEDEPFMRDIYIQILDEAGFVTAGFADGQSAIEALANRRVNPHLILLDYMLPGKNGDDFVSRLVKFQALDLFQSSLLAF